MIGTKLRHLNDANLKKLEEMIQSLPYKVEVKTVNYVNGNWFAHFTIRDTMELVPTKEISEQDINKQKATKKKKKVNRRK